MFQCDKCGLCCKTVGSNQLYKYLANEAGVCINFDTRTNLCKIYQDRPVICRVDEFYNNYLSQTMSHEEYYELNYAACKILKNAMECGQDDVE